jgi:hypothetical protein
LIFVNSGQVPETHAGGVVTIAGTDGTAGGAGNCATHGPLGPSRHPQREMKECTCRARHYFAVHQNFELRASLIIHGHRARAGRTRPASRSFFVSARGAAGRIWRPFSSHLVNPIRACWRLLGRDGRHGSTKPIPANRRSRRRSNNECRCRSDYFIRASRNFFALRSFFFSLLRRWCDGQAAWQNQGK